MRTIEDLKEMALKIIEQGKAIKDINPTAYKLLDQRLTALLWVLEDSRIATLIFTEAELRWLSTFW